MLFAALCWTGIVYASPLGSDSAPGTETAPVRSLSRAVEVARSSRSSHIELASGTYRLEEAVVLGPQDAGLTIRGPSDRSALIVGSQELDSKPSERQFPAAKAQVEQAHLPTDSWNIVETGWGASLVPVMPEVLFDGRTGQIARWPNAGYASADRRTPDGLDYEANVPHATSDHMWARGYWGQEWADWLSPIVDYTPGHEFEIRSAGSYAAKPKARFQLVNAPEFLDVPGEYWVDPDTLVVYFIRPQGCTHTEVSVLDTPLIDLARTQNVHVQNVTLQGGRFDGIRAASCQGLTVDNCLIQSFGVNGIETSNCSETRISGSTIRGCGASALVLDGGDRAGLRAANTVVSDCDIEQTNRLWRTAGKGAIQVGGMGVMISHNAIHHTPYIGIMMIGANDVTITGNEIYKTCLEVDDSGSVYAGRDWSMRGITVTDNYFHDLKRIGREGLQAVYLDDMLSGAKVTGNIFQRVDRAVMIGGGSDNAFQGDLIVDCPNGMALDARGLDWAAEGVTKPGGMIDNFRHSPATRQTWRKRYPELAQFDPNQGGTPRGNVVTQNVFVRSPDGQIAPLFRASNSISNVSLPQAGSATLADLELATRQQRGGVVIHTTVFGPNFPR